MNRDNYQRESARKPRGLMRHPVAVVALLNSKLAFLGGLGNNIRIAQNR